MSAEARVVAVAQSLIAGLDRAYDWRREKGHSTKELDFAIGATLELRSALQDLPAAPPSPEQEQQ